MTIRAGQLRDYATIEKVGPNDAAGNPSGWTTFASVYVEVVPVSGKELIGAQELASPILTVLKTYYIKGVTPEMRVKLGTRIFNIRYPIDIENKHEELDLYCVEVL